MAKATVPTKAAVKKAATPKEPKAPKAPKNITPQSSGESPKEPTPLITQDEVKGGEGPQAPTPPVVGDVEENADKGFINASDETGSDEQNGGENIPANVSDETESDLVEDAEIAELKARYKKAYPSAKSLLISSDSQIFLDSNRADALYHQKGLDKQKELIELPL